jgi:hypothetical protein
MLQSRSIFAPVGIASRIIAETSFSQGRSTACYFSILRTFVFIAGIV